MFYGDTGFYGDTEFYGSMALEVTGPLSLEADVSAETKFQIKQNDTLPSLLRQMVDANGVPINLSDAASVKFIMSTPSGGAVVNAAAVIVDRVGGWVRYDWSVVDTATVGPYRGEFQATMNDGAVLTAPTSDYIKIRVYDDLGD